MNFAKWRWLNESSHEITGDTVKIFAPGKVDFFCSPIPGADGCGIDAEAMWLKICRAGNVFSTHYSLDGKNYRMARLFYLPVSATVKVGLAAQCPLGESGGERIFSEITLENKTVQNLRAGV